VIGGIVATSVVAAVFTGSDHAEDGGQEDSSTPSAGAEGDFNSRFVWRGIALSRGAVAQPSCWVSGLGWTAAFWANLTMTPEARKDRANALVPSLTYAYRWKALELDPGLFLYTSSSQGERPTTVEASLDLSYALGGLRLRSSGKLDVVMYPRAYFGTIGAEYEQSSGRWSLESSVELGWANAPFNRAHLHVDTGALDVIELGVASRYALTDLIYVSPHAELSVRIAPAIGRHERTLVRGGGAWGIEF
jgi:hypothetical protein